MPAGAAKSGVSLRLTTVSLDSFKTSAAAQSLPKTLESKSPLYQPNLQGQMPTLAVLSMPIPDNADPLTTLDVYAYSSKKWTKLPFQLFRDEQRIEAYLTVSIPEGILVAQTRPQAPAISSDISAGNPLPAAASSLLAEINPVGLMIADRGGIAGSLPTAAEAGPNSPYQVLPTISNLVGTQLRSDLVDLMVTDAGVRKQHVQALVDLAVEKVYPGLNIDYQGVTAENRADFSNFVQELAKGLHAKNKVLSVTVSMPSGKSADIWDTGPYDWDVIGREADIVKIPLPLNASAYTGNPSAVQSYLQWAVGRVDRYKIELFFSIQGRDQSDQSFGPINLANALSLLGPLSTSGQVDPGSKAVFDLPRVREGGLKADPATGLYTFNYKDGSGQQHTVWLESAESIAKKTSLALKFNLRGIDVHDLAGVVDARAWEALKQYRQSQEAAYRAIPAVVWRVNGQVAGKSPASDPRLTWTAPSQSGSTKVEAYLSFDDGSTLAGMTGATTIQIAAKGPTPRPTSTPRPTAVPGAPTAKPAVAPTKAPPPPVASSFVGKNMFGYGAQLNWTNNDPNGEMGQLSQMGFRWAKVQIRWCDFEGSKGSIDYGMMDRLVAAAGAKGIKVLFSVVCAPNWSRADGGAGGSGPPDNMQNAADFMGNLAAHFCGSALGAIEVWNEHNLLTEWHGKPISAALYMDMLKRSYAAIKQRCGSIVVVSGAPTPTGVNSSTAIDDVSFLTQLYQNGLKQYSDAIGAHPSGFCNPADAAPGTPNAIGQFQGHRSFYFRGTMESYRAVMVQNGDGGKQIWPTEFGWGVAAAPKPGYEYEKFITEDQQAAWLVKAYQMMRSWGWVGVAFVWNLDFMDMNNETGAFHILNRPAFGALAGMPK